MPFRNRLSPCYHCVGGSPCQSAVLRRPCSWGREPGPKGARRDGHPTAGMGVSRERCAPVPVCGSTKMERFPQISSVLEGNVVVSYRGGGLRAALFAGNFSAGFLSIVPRTEQDNVPRHNLRSIFLYAILSVFPGGCLQLAFNVELRSLADVLSHDLRQTLPSHNAVPFCSVLPLVVPVFESFVRGQADFSDRNSTGRVLDLRILSNVSHQRKWWNWRTKHLAARTPAQIWTRETTTSKAICYCPQLKRSRMLVPRDGPTRGCPQPCRADCSNPMCGYTK